MGVLYRSILRFPKLIYCFLLQKIGVPARKKTCETLRMSAATLSAPKQAAHFFSGWQTIYVVGTSALTLILCQIFNSLFEIRSCPSFLVIADDPTLLVGTALFILVLTVLLTPPSLDFVRRWTNHKSAALPDILLTGIGVGLLWPALRQGPDWLETRNPLFLGTLTILLFQEARLRTLGHPKRYVLNPARFGLPTMDEAPLAEITTNSDQLGRLPFCKMLTDKLSTTARDGAQVIGLSGSWGSGKTSVLNHCAAELEKLPQKPLVIAFDAWLFRDTDRLIEGLLGLIGKEIEKNYLYRDARALTLQLARILAAGASCVRNQPTFNNLSKLFEPSDDPVKLRQKFAHLIEKTGEHFIVFIDDVERLNQGEVHALLKTVREGALVPGITFLLSYDRAHLVQLLGAASEVGTGYLEKIVQEEIELTRPDLTKWRVFAKSELNAVIEGAKGTLAADFHERLDKVESEFAEVAQTPRHVKRIRIAVKNIAGRMHRFLNPFDLLILELLRQRHRTLYDLIRKHPKFFCDPRGVQAYVKRMRLDDEAEISHVKAAIDECLKGTGLDRSAVEKLLAAIFPSIGGATIRDEVAFRLRRICDPAYFDWYFNLKHLDDIPEQGEIEDIIAALNVAPTKEKRKELLISHLLKEGDAMLSNRFGGLRAFVSDFLPSAILPTVEVLLDCSAVLAVMERDSGVHRYNSCALFLHELITGLGEEDKIADGMAFAIARSPNVIFAYELRTLVMYDDGPTAVLTERCKQAFDLFVHCTFIEPNRDIFAEDINTRVIVVECFSNKDQMREYLSKWLDENPANWLRLLRQYVIVHNDDYGRKLSEPLIQLRNEEILKSPLWDRLIPAIRGLPMQEDGITARIVEAFLRWADISQQGTATELGAVTPGNAEKPQ